MAYLLRSHWPRIHWKEFKQTIPERLYSELFKFTGLEIEQLGSNSCSDSCKLIGQITYTLSHSFLSYKCFYLVMNKIMYMYVCVCVCVCFPSGSSGKEPTCQCRRHKRLGFDPWVRKIPWRREWQPTLVFLPGESLWTEEPGRLQSMGSQRVGHEWSNLA